MCSRMYKQRCTVFFFLNTARQCLLALWVLVVRFRRHQLLDVPVARDLCLMKMDTIALMLMSVIPRIMAALEIV